MNMFTIVSKAKQNDSLLSKLSENWKSNSRCEDPVLTALKEYRIFNKLVILSFFSFLSFALTLVCVFESIHNPAFKAQGYGLISGMIFALSLAGVLVTIWIPGRYPSKNAKAFIETLTVIEKHLDYSNDGPDPTFWKLGHYDSKRWLEIGHDILKPMTDQIKVLEKYDWLKENAVKLKDEFLQLHSRLARIGFAEKDHAVYWQ